MAIENLITDNINTWTAAINTKSATGRGSSKKIELYGIKKLRELILELAVRGKLVPQDPNDEPASVLLERIAVEKVLLVKNKRIKKPKKLPVITEDECKFNLPIGWKWCRLGEVVEIIRGITFPASAKEFTPSGDNIACLRTANVQKNIDWDDLIYVKKSFIKQEEQNLEFGDIVMSMANSRELVGKVSYTHSIPTIKATFGGFLSVIRPFEIDSSFLMTLLRTPNIRETLIGSASQTTNIANISLEKLNPLVISIPPLAEQHRIVAKVDELMVLCDQLEQQTESSIDAHKTLVEVLLATLTDSKNANDLNQNWARVSEFFDTLFTTENSIDQLKQTILQLAVMGKLVPQDSKDEPASKLLERIAAEKTQLIKDKKIKKHPPVTPIGELKNIPLSWQSIVVQDFADIRLGSTPSRHEAKYWKGNIPWVSSGEVANNIITDTAEKITEDGFNNSSTTIIPSRSVLMAIIGQGKTRGQTALLGIDACTNQNIAAFVFNEKYVIPEYVLLWAQSKYESHRRGGHGGAQPALNGKKVRSFAFPLSPTSEQKRIVSKVKDLMDICEQLKSRISEAQQTRLHLADVIVEKAV
ncbi:restriction endonuclease subunit S [Psychromonas sp. GE-S-Ul-11]|uniref:restriction endonuclease subunit S n=1 Tax=Psychromonas sp. GE-S-Ul-11 TaxID=3241170 RepID=UPI00390C4A49